MLNAMLKSAAEANPQKVALVYGESKICYQDLLEKIESFSNGLKSLGIGEGDCVAILLPNCPEFAISFYAITALGGAVPTAKSSIQVG